MSSWRPLKEENITTAPLIILCQDYIALDEDFAANKTVKRNRNESSFWIEMAHFAYGMIKLHLQESIDPEFDEDFEVSDLMVLKFIMDLKTRFDLNDILCNSISEFLQQRGTEIKE